MLGIVACVGAPLWLGLVAIFDLLSLKPRLPRTRGVAFLIWYLFCELWGSLLGMVIWVLWLGGRRGGPLAWLEVNALMQRWWTQALFDGTRVIYQMRSVIEGTEVARHGPFLLFVRHTSTADTVVAAVLIANPNKILMKYVAKKELLWDPCLDLIGQRLPNAFVDRSGGRTGNDVQAVADLARNLDAHSVVLIYPEGTRYSVAKRDAQVEKLKAQGKTELAARAAQFQHVLPPKLGGPLALIAAAPGVDIVILEHTGFEGAATMRTFFGGAMIGGTLRVRLRRIKASDIPAVGREQWLFEQWLEVEHFVATHVADANR